MKKKYFIVISIIQIIVCLLVIAFSNTTATNLVNRMNIDTELYAQENDLFKTNNETLDALLDMSNPDNLRGMYQRYIIVFCIIIVLMSIITIIIPKNNHVLRRKKRLVVYSVFSLLIGPSLFINLIGLVNLIILLTLKRTEEEDNPLPKEKITPLEYVYRNKKGVLLGILSIVSYIVLYVGVRRFLNLLFPVIPQAVLDGMLFLVSINVVVLLIIVTIYKDELLNGLRAVKADFNNYRRFIIKSFLITILLSFISNIIRAIFTKNFTSVNQLELFELPFLYLAFAAVLWAPIVEECVFRGALRRMIPNKYVFVVLSAIVFGLLHTLAEDGISNILITAIPYGIIGVCLAVVYEKSNNIITNIAVHALNNLVGVVAVFIMFGV